MEKKQIRCAIYTRKSNEEGLEQNFNSLDAQRESCEAYIKSQTHEGWKIIPKHYDDGGYSGGTMNRPAFIELLKDIEEEKIDIVVVYKVDRLTRSLMDFSKIVDTLDKHNASFVSITQHFNTTTSMGRLTLNILLSFAQFEREVTGERIRDKFAASAKKGLWITGIPPLGYKKEGDVLIEDKEHSWKIELIFSKYLELASVDRLKVYLDENNIHTRSGKRFSQGNLYHILSNKVYLGKIVKGQNIYEGKHLQIISTQLFESVKNKLASNTVHSIDTPRKNSNAMLQGKLFDNNGSYYSPSRSTGRNGKIYNYYINQDLKQGKTNKKSCIPRIPRDEIENFVYEKIKDYISNPENIQKIIKEKSIKEQIPLLNTLKDHCIDKNQARSLIVKVLIENKHIEILLSRNNIYKLITSETNFEKDITITLNCEGNISQCGQKGNSIVIGKGKHYNQTLVDAIVKGFYYNKSILDGNITEEIQTRNARRLRKLRFLPPKLIEDILKGKQDRNLTVEKLCLMAS